MVKERISFGVDLQGYEIYSDSKDIKVIDDSKVSDYSMIYDWCDQQKINAIKMLSTSGFSIWRIEDEAKRVWFALKWTKDEKAD
jgi:spore germination protein YaaH